MKISIITINYNNKTGLLKTIESVIKQTLNDYEYIIIDGASNDGSLEVIHQYVEKIDCWVSEPDSGIYNAMNKGIMKAKGDYCIFMNSGDTFYDKDTLKEILPYLDGTCIVNGDTSYPSGKYDNSPKEVTLGFFLLSTIIHQSTFIRTDLLKNNNYDEKYRIVSDWKFWIQELIINNVSYKNVHIPISIFDETGVGSTNIALHDDEMVLVLKELFPIKILKEYYFFMNGKTCENKLYIEIQHSKFHKIFYTINSSIVKFVTFFKSSSKWAKKYPLFYKKNMINHDVMEDVYGSRNILKRIVED